MRSSLKARVSIGAAAALLLALIAVVPALASSSATPALAPLGTSAAPLSALTANGASTKYGGWEFKPAGATSVVALFKLPALTCTSTTSGVGPGTFMLTGSSSASNFNAAGVAMECKNGAEQAAPDLIVDGAVTESTHPVFTGDLMRATVSTSSTRTIATIRDLTAGHTFTFSRRGAGATAFEELVIDDSLVCSCSQLPVADFGTMRFTGGSVGGKPLGSVTPSQAVNMETSAHVLQILTGGLTGKKQNAFTTTWKHS